MLIVPRVAVVVGGFSEVDLSEVARAVGSSSFARGRAYAGGNRVLRTEWDPAEEALTGSVLGHGGLYNTVAYFEPGDDGTLAFVEGECSCPVAYDCKHVAAIVVAAAARPTTGGFATLAATGGTAGSGSHSGSWEEPLRALIDADSARGTGKPLAIELALQWSGPGRGTPRLVARLMRPGARGGWVNGSLAWSGLDSWQLAHAGYRQDHAQLLRELYAVYRTRMGRSAYYYGYGTEKTIDLSECESPQLWAVLTEAGRKGLQLIHANPALGDVECRGHGEVVLDVTADGGRGSQVAAVLRLDGEPAAELQPLLFAGSTGHGVICAERADIEAGHPSDDWRLRLVGLLTPARPALQRLLLAGEQLDVPERDTDRFALELCPALSRVAPVVSSDGSFTPPEVSAPRLVLDVAHRSDYTVEASWEWAYQVGEVMRRAPLQANGSGPVFRDLEAERAILARTEVIETGIEHFGLLDDTARPAAGAPVTLSGLDAMRFSTHALPKLRETPDLDVQITGQPPDYRDVGDSLEIGLSTEEVVGERDWFDLGVTIAVEGRELAFAEVFVALARGQSDMLLPDGAHFSLLDRRLQELRRLIEEARAMSDSPAAPLRISRYQAGLWAEFAALGVVTEQAEAWERQVGALLGLDSISDHQPPGSLTAQLRPYQRDGFNWLASLWEFELGGILADDMGLGKTLQALALVLHTRATKPDAAPFLVVAPTSVVSNWVSEAARFTPALKVEAVTDTLAKSGRTIEALMSANVVVTTYTLLRLEADTYRSVRWAGLILDEAQYVKNHQAKTYGCVRKLDAPVKVAITGTPMENNLMELWSLLSITAPGLFPDPKRFAEHYARPIERGGDAERLARLRRRIKPLVKRRTKELVAAELPAKQEQTLELSLHPRHRKLYDTRLQRERQKILGLIDDFDRNRFTILRSITVLRQLSLHAGLVDSQHERVPCAKLDALAEQLGEVAHGRHRALVFSQFTGFLARVKERLDKEGLGYCYLDGRTRRRDRVIERFKQGEDPVFLISLKAGGFGLNLTEADYCFLLDPWWNPAIENQAIDRAHRIGQTRPVVAYRLIARETIEEKVVALARRKAQLFSGVMDDGDLFASSLTAEDVRALLD